MERVEETKLGGMGIFISPLLANTLFFDIGHLFNQFLNQCVVASTSENTFFPIAAVPFSLDPILVEL